MGIVASFKNPLQIRKFIFDVCGETLEVEMRLKMNARQEVTAVTAVQYRGASKKEKRVLLDQFVSTTGYSRWYARYVLRHEGQYHRQSLTFTSSVFY